MSQLSPKNTLPIAIPLKRKINRFQAKVVPIMVFGVVVLVTAMIWFDTISPSMLAGQVMASNASVNSPVAARIGRMHVKQLQLVKQGDLIAELQPTDPRQVLAGVQEKLNLLRFRASATDAGSNQRREAMDFERLRLDWLVEKVNLATATAVMLKASMDLDLATSMASSATAARYKEVAEIAKRSAEAEVAERADLVNSLGLRLKELTPRTSSTGTGIDETLTREINTIEESIAATEASQSIIKLHAPIDGIITDVLRGSGENVASGEALAIIHATQSERIIGYLRQPFPIEPEVGQVVEVRGLGRGRPLDFASITRVGSTYEPILNPALHPAPTPEVGLPVEISIPPNMSLRPGEIVNLVIRSSSTAKPLP